MGAAPKTMASNTYTSKLEAVNTILAVVGSAPLNSLSGSQTAEDRAAVLVLDEVVREICIRGWHFNTEYGVSLVPDNSGNIVIPENFARVDLDVPSYPRKNVVIKDGKLYDKEGHSFSWGGPVKATVIYLYDFEELPEIARQYAMIRAARKFQERFMGSANHSAFSQRDELFAEANLRNQEAQDGDYTIFDNFGAFRIINRGNPLRGMG